LAVLLAAVAVYAYLNTGTTHATSTYNPTLSVKYCNNLQSFSANGNYGAADTVPTGDCTGVNAENLAQGAAANVTTILSEPSGDANFSAVVTLAPAASTTVAGAPASVGQLVGGLEANAVLGIGNTACNDALDIDFIAYNIALPNVASETTPGDVRTATNLAYPRQEGASNRFNGWDIGVLPPPTGGTPPGTGGNALSDSILVQNYPAYMLDVFDPDLTPGVAQIPAFGAAPPIIPTALYGGATLVQGSWVPLYFAFFAPGALAPFGAGTPLGNLTAAMGQPQVSVLLDPAENLNFPSTITDFCTPLTVTSMFLGTACTASTGVLNAGCTTPGALRGSSPPCAPVATCTTTGYTLQYNVSARDTDQDGIENSLDTCPVTTTAPGSNPRIGGSGDPDLDGIDSVCEPNPSPGPADVNAADWDGPGPGTVGDGFQNRQDNCPLVANNLGGVVPAGGNAGTTAQKDSENGVLVPGDNGPRTDAIGDACDSEVGALTVVQNRSSGTATLSITMSDTAANGRYQEVINTVAKCFFGTAGTNDTDGDGYCTADDGVQAGVCAGTTPPSCAVRHTGWSAASAPGQLDNDGDGYSDAKETYMGTDPTKSCAMTPVPLGIAGGAGDELKDNFPADFNDDRLVGIGDVTTMSGIYNKPVNDGAYVSPVTPAQPEKRWDLTADGFIGIGDVTLGFSTNYNKRCGQGTAGMPGPFVQQ
jgi:hypothetical protein